MKTSILLIILFTTLINSNSFSTPLNGTYTIGNGGNYPTINSATVDVENQGINGPVIFNIISGIYNENVTINSIPGSSLLNTITLKSQSGNSSDVETGSLLINASNIVIKNLSINYPNGVELRGGYQRNISIINNDFRNHDLGVYVLDFSNTSNINILENINVSNMYISGQYHFGTWWLDSVQIKNNIVNGILYFNICRYILAESNTIYGGIQGNIKESKFIKNKITGLVMANGDFYNNFIYGQVQFRFDFNNNFSNNTVVGGTIAIPTLSNLLGCRNNIIINPVGGPTAFLNSTNLGSDYNVFYNGGNSNLLDYNGTYYNNVQDFYIATGLDQHSSDQPVNFISPTDLHLAPTSFGDPLLVGMHDDAVIDDIDGQTRSLTSPYKGADEVIDLPLPIELSVFNSSVNLNNVNLFWTTTSEINNLGFVIERSINNLEWLNVNFVQGHGTTTAINNYEYSDKGLNPGKFNYRLKQLDYNGNFEYYNLSEDVLIGSPDKFSLSQNYPNPFNPNTIINYQLATNSNVTIKVYDISGKEVLTLLNQFKVAGSYSINFNGSSFASGVYYYKIIAGNFISTKKMLLLK